MRPPLGWKTGSPPPISGGKWNRSSSRPEAAVVAALGLLQPVQMLGQRLVGLPGGAVDPLEHLPVLVAPPVGAGHPHELERPEAAGGRDVGAAAQVGPAPARIGTVPVDAHLVAAGALVGLHALDDLHLVGLVGEALQALLPGQVLPDEGLVLGHDRPHAGLDAPEVLLGERGPAGEIEVVVEAVLDGRPDGVLGPREEVADGLGQDVGGGVAEDVAPGVGIGGDDRHLATVGQRCRQVDLGPVDGGGNGRLGQPPPDRLGQVGGGGPWFEGSGRPVGQGDGDLAWRDLVRRGVVGHVPIETTGRPPVALEGNPGRVG